jgi:hypothetical protein
MPEVPQQLEANHPPQRGVQALCQVLTTSLATHPQRGYFS